MNTRSKGLILFSFLVAMSMVLGACATPTPEKVVETVVVEKEGEKVVETVEVIKTVEVEVFAPTPEPVPTTRKGGWLDEIVFTVVGAQSAVTQLNAKAIDIYASGLSSADLPTIQEAGLNYTSQAGLYYELTFNPVGPVFEESTGALNPFSSAKVREAMNWLVDREYINQEVYAGGAELKFFPITTKFPDYADLADVVRGLEAKYAYNPEKAEEVISAEVTAMGAEKVDGKWMFNGEPVTLIFLIRNDSDRTRIPIGDYVANQLENIGFTVDRQYKTSSESSPLWILGNPADGLWHLYTGAWSATVIDRDQGDNFQFFYDPSSVYGFSPLWQAYTPTPEFFEALDKLAYNKFDNLEQRRETFATALELALENSVRVFLIDGKNFAPYNTDVQVTYDLAAGIMGSGLWPLTLRFVGEEGGRMKWGQPDLFTDPWNPVAGSNWAFDASAQRGIAGGSIIADPHTGLFWPLFMERAEITIQEGLPVGKTLDWVDLKFEAEIAVPADAWADWDATTQTFITVGDKFPEGATAKRKSVVYYPADLFDKIKWHDGSSLSVADFVMGLIMTFDPAKPESAIYDEATVSNLEGFLSVFKGVKIASTDPLTIEYYADSYELDAEWNVVTLWPDYGYGEAPWHAIALGNMADAAGELAYSADKADASEIEWMSLIGGPSLEILAGHLATAIAESTIPYAPTMSEFLTAEEAAARYANMQAWYDAHNHFWVGTGAYYLDKVFLTEKTLTLLHNQDYPDLANRWEVFAAPRIAEVEIDGPGQVTIGAEAVFDIFVTFEGKPYPQDQVKEVKFLLYNAKGEIVNVGQAAAVADGQYQATLTAEITGALEAGSNKLEVAVVVLPVSIPTFATYEFVTAP